MIGTDGRPLHPLQSCLGDAQGPPSPRSSSGWWRIPVALGLVGFIAGAIWLASHDTAHTVRR